MTRRRKRPPYGDTTKSILELMREHGTRTRAQLEAALGKGAPISGHLSRLKNAGRIHVAHYTREGEPGSRNYLRAAYALGDLPDAPKPPPIPPGCGRGRPLAPLGSRNWRENVPASVWDLALEPAKRITERRAAVQHIFTSGNTSGRIAPHE